MRWWAPDRLAFGLALAGLAGCTFADGDPWGEGDVTVTARFEVPAARRTEAGELRTSQDYAVRVDTLRLVFGAVTATVSEEGAAAGFDPAHPPEGFTLCHNGHCHGPEGKLFDYAEVAALLAGDGEADSAPALAADVGGPDGVELSDGTPVSVPVAGCPCDLPRGTLAAARLSVTALHVEGVVRDLRPVSRLGAETRPVALDIPLDVTFSAPLDEAIGRGEPVPVGLDVQLSLTAKVLDAVDFAADAAPSTYSQATSETVRTDSDFTLDVTR